MEHLTGLNEALSGQVRVVEERLETANNEKAKIEVSLFFNSVYSIGNLSELLE